MACRSLPAESPRSLGKSQPHPGSRKFLQSRNFLTTKSRQKYSIVQIVIHSLLVKNGYSAVLLFSSSVAAEDFL